MVHDKKKIKEKGLITCFWNKFCDEALAVSYAYDSCFMLNFDIAQRIMFKNTEGQDRFP